MIESRGFSRFRQFNQKLIELYKSKELNQNIADLFPAIINGVKANNRSIINTTKGIETTITQNESIKRIKSSACICE